MSRRFKPFFRQPLKTCFQQQQYFLGKSGSHGGMTRKSWLELTRVEIRNKKVKGMVHMASGAREEGRDEVPNRVNLAQCLAQFWGRVRIQREHYLEKVRYKTQQTTGLQEKQWVLSSEGFILDSLPCSS